MKPTHLLLVCLLFFFHISYGYADDLHFKHYNNKQGLSYNTVYCSLQDKKGFMWFGTEDGLNRFDGHSFKVYRHNSYDPNSLSGDRIISLFEDSSEKIWICTTRGTCYYDHKSDQFYPFFLSEDKNEPSYFTFVREDKHHQLWFSESGQIVRYTQDNQQTKIYPASNYFYPNLISLTTDGEPFFADDRSLYLYKPESDSFTRIQILNQKKFNNQGSIQAICPIPELGYLIGTDKAGLLLYNSQEQSTSTIIPDTQIRVITPYTNTTYWIGSESGVYIYNLITQSVINLKKSLTNEYTISDNAIYSLTKDREGGMWIGTFFSGINYLPKEYTRFNPFIGGKTHPQMLGNAVREIVPDEYDNLWLGTEDNGINCYNPKTGQITNYSYNNPNHPLSATNIHGLYAEGNRLWVGTYNKGIDVLDIPTGRIIKRYTRENTGNTLKSDFILCFCRTRNNDFLIGTSTGIIKYNNQTDRFESWNQINGLIRQIYEDSRGNIWAATSNGIFHYLQQSNTMEHFTHDRNNFQTIGNNNTTSIFEDSQGHIWITSVNGISLFDHKNNTFQRITTENGLPSNIVYRIVEDNESNFWLATANGLVRYNPITKIMRTYGYTDGLHETQFNYSSSYKAPDGTIYMGTINGMLSFKPEQFREDTFIPPVYITRIHVPQHEDEKHNSINSSIENIQTLRLPYNASTFTLSYIALSYTSPEAIRYAYMLKGVDKNWIQMGENKDVTFANLSPGEYTFKVKSTNSSGIWQENEQSIHIIITPPFWATDWAFLFYTIMACALTGWFYHYKKRKLEEKHRINQDLFESKKEKELYDAKIQFFTFITHEIRTPLTLIKAPLEKILRSDDGTPSTRENLRIIEKNTQQLLNLSNQLLDFRKTENRGFKLNYVRTDITLWMHTLLQPFLPVMEKEKKTFSSDIPAGPIFGYIDRDALTKIVNNLLTNAVKYSEKYISLQIQFREEDKKFSITITNDGSLIPENEKENIFIPFYRLKETENQLGSGIGLSLARSLTEFHNGSLTYRQTSEKRNQFLLILPQEQKDCYLMVAEKETMESPSPVSATRDSGKPIVLIVEDQADMRRFIANELTETYQVVEAENGKSAIEWLKNNVVNLIISDVMMPVMDGFELCNTVKNDINYSHIPFILLTAQHNLQSRLQGLNNGADAYMEKPFSIELLIAQIANLLKSRETLTRTYQEIPTTPFATLAISAVDDIFLQKLNEFIDNNITNEALNVETLASEMGMSTSSLYRKVKGLSGLTPVEFIKISRLKKAVRFMQEGESRINEIAFRTGFSSPAYFSTCFLKQYGKSPSEYISSLSTNNGTIR